MDIRFLLKSQPTSLVYNHIGKANRVKKQSYLKSLRQQRLIAHYIRLTISTERKAHRHF